MPSLIPSPNAQTANPLGQNLAQSPAAIPASPAAPGQIPGQSQTMDPLANLRDIQLPSDVSALPAFGWWLLAATALFTLIAFGYFLWRRYKQRQYRRAAQRLHGEILKSEDSEAQKLQSLNELLKRVAIYAYPQTSVAGLHGAQWQALLQRGCPELSIDEGIAHALTDQRYSGQTVDADQLKRFDDYVKAWIHKHGTLKPAAAVSVTNTSSAQSTTAKGGQHAHV
ncbi:MAG: DUF4381 domain-containing protein [Cellvibrionaceae bacterium]